MPTRQWIGVGLAAAALFLAACTGSNTPASTDGTAALPVPAVEGIPALSDLQSRPARTPRPPTFIEGEFTFMEQQVVNFLLSEFPDLDVARRIIPIRELTSGGVGVDSGIPSIQNPTFVTAESAAAWLGDREPVVALEVQGEARIYPIQILMWHEMVTDTLGGVPVVATFCPLCNTALAFDRRLNGEVYHFGVSGLLRESDLVMYDMETQTLWQQATGEGIVGTLAGQRLTFLPAFLVGFEEARTAFPDALVLSRETGFRRDYGMNPYGGYDRVDSAFLAPTSFDDDGRLPAKVRVLTVDLGGDPVAINFQTMARHRVVQFESAGVPLVAIWEAGTSTPLDVPRMADAREIGAASAFLRELDGELLEFEVRDGAVFDRGSGSRWSVTGMATSGPREGQRLTPVVTGNHFWFSWAVFQPNTRIIGE